MTDNYVSYGDQPNAHITTVPVPFQPKTSGTAWVLFLFLGGFSAHRFYLGQTGRALAQLFTFQFLGVAVIIDLFTLNRDIKTVNENAWAEYQRRLNETVR